MPLARVLAFVAAMFISLCLSTNFVAVGIDDIALTRALEGRDLEEDEVHGYLEKLPLIYQGEIKSDAESTEWKRRYFRMRFADLEYAVSAASICPKGTIKLDASSELVLETEPYTFTLKCQVLKNKTRTRQNICCV